jgi:hypothetical protein
MARRPDYWKKEEVWSREDLEEIARNLAVLSEPAVRAKFINGRIESVRSSTAARFPPRGRSRNS